MIKALLLDIEGTTTPITFVHKTLFPYAQENMSAFVRENWDEIEIERKQLAIDYQSESTYPEALDENSHDSVTNFLNFLIENDRKSTPLKSIQGKLWQKGYESGELFSQVFDDVKPALEAWRGAGKDVAIYSSGSVLAQKLLFRYTDHGDLTPFICDHFDTNIGHKRDEDSYKRISEKLDLDPGRILFVSDIVEELDAAADAGMQTALSVRPGNAFVENCTAHSRIRSFDELAV